MRGHCRLSPLSSMAVVVAPWMPTYFPKWTAPPIPTSTGTGSYEHPLDDFFVRSSICKKFPECATRSNTAGGRPLIERKRVVSGHGTIPARILGMETIRQAAESRLITAGKIPLWGGRMARGAPTVQARAWGCGGILEDAWEFVPASEAHQAGGCPRSPCRSQKQACGPIGKRPESRLGFGTEREIPRARDTLIRAMKEAELPRAGLRREGERIILR